MPFNQSVLRILAFLRTQANIKTMIDFRDKGEKEDDPNDELIEKAYPTVHNFPLLVSSFRGIQVDNLFFFISGS